MGSTVGPGQWARPVSPVAQPTELRECTQSCETQAASKAYTSREINLKLRIYIFVITRGDKQHTQVGPHLGLVG